MSGKYLGVLSRATYEDLPPDFQAIARELAEQGRFDIEGVPGQLAGAQEHGKHVVCH
jgi:hypothetical protein